MGDGRMGNGTLLGSPTPQTVPTIDDAIAVAAGWGHTCALRRGGSVVCWGDMKAGAGDLNEKPHEVKDVAGVVQISAASSRTCARKSDGSVVCWGSATGPNFGGGTSLEAIGGLGVVSRIVVGMGGHSCAIADGRAQCWFGVLGSGVSKPTRLPIEEKLVDLVLGGEGRGCAIGQSGKTYCWVLAPAADPFAPRPMAIFEKANGIALGFAHACAISNQGELACWGRNDGGQLGDGTRTSRTAPRVILPQLAAER